MDDVMEIFQGDDEPFELFFEDENHDPLDITDYFIKWSFKGPFDDAILGEKDSDNILQIEKTDSENGLAVLYLVGADTKDQDVKSYEFDVQVTINGNNRTYKKGIFVIKGDVSTP